MSVQAPPAPLRPEGTREDEREGTRLAQPRYVLLATTLALLAGGLVMILSASSVEAFKLYGSSFLFFKRQLVVTVLGLGLMVVLAAIDYRRLRRFARPLFAVVLVLLVAVLIPWVGVTRGGSTRWLAIGSITLQPSELAKLSLILVSAHILAKKGARIADRRQLIVPLLPMTGLVSLLVLAQPDLGTALICASVVVTVMFLAGARGRHLGMILLGGGAAVIVAILAEGYRRARLFSFLDPWADPLNTGYQIIQGQIALGSGGWLGVGLGASRQKWSYLPNAHTDFIFAILGEELGLVGTLAVLFLFVALIASGVTIARRAPDRFGFLLAGGITSWIGVQALVNMGAVTGMLPITGVPLPLLSFGGSSLLFTLAGIGILVSIARRSRA